MVAVVYSSLACALRFNRAVGLAKDITLRVSFLSTTREVWQRPLRRMRSHDKFRSGPHRRYRYRGVVSGGLWDA